MINVNKISKKYGKRYVFKNISFDIKDREKLLIIGPSGCGKTTLIRCLNGLNKVNSGNIFLNGVKINQIDDLVKKLLSKVNIINKIDSYPSKLSGGEKQRVAIARTLATKPEVILFDEPTSALDPATISDFILLLKELSRTTTIVVVSHEMDLIKSFADKVLFLKNGSILEYGTADEILNSKNEEVRNFLGK